MSNRHAGQRLLRTLVSVGLGAFLLTATASALHACFFTCMWEFGTIEVDNGKVYYYEGCTETISDTGVRIIICYYGSLS